MSKARDIWSLESHVVRTRLNGLQLYANALNAEKKIYSETLKNIPIKSESRQDVANFQRFEFDINEERVNALQYSPNLDDVKKSAEKFLKFAAIKEEMNKRARK